MPQNLTLSELTAISPLDGRYRKSIGELAQYCSEFALIRTRLALEAQYLIALSEEGIIRTLTDDERRTLTEAGADFSPDDAQKIKDIEETTKHDVKAMELFFREYVKGSSLADLTEMIHFGLTSEDINNLAYRLLLKRATYSVLLPELAHLTGLLVTLAEAHKAVPMLGRTHGQPAVPTTLGKELAVFAGRLGKELALLKNTQLSGKLAGAVGNFNALSIAYPDTDWPDFSKRFVASLGLTPNPAVTQINTFEDVVSFLQIIQRINGIILDLDQDMWRYVSDGYFIQEVRTEEVGSSTMPQKVNPIRFENSEGNVGLANALIEYMVRKLPVSRLQRDLSDSTTVRNFGTILGYSLLAYKNTRDGLRRIRPDTEKIAEDLNRDWSILAEAVQTILRKEGIDDPYSLIKSLTRGTTIDSNEWRDWVDGLPVHDGVKKTLHGLTPETYIGLAPTLVDTILAEIDTTTI